jgi:RNA polymerase sigma factor (sigma-70 family)
MTDSIIPASHTHQPYPDRVSGTSCAELSDGALLEAVRCGHIDAYGLLFVRHRNAAVIIAKGILGNHDLSQDAAHEAFSSILSAIQGGAGPVGTFKGYLRATVTRLAYRLAQQRAREAPVGEHAEIDHPVEDFSDHLFDDVLREAFRSLPRRWQLAIWYLDVEDLQPSDVAAHFGLTPNALVALHRRAKKGWMRAYTKYP